MIDNNDIIKDGLFDDAIKNAVKLASSLDTLEDSFKGILSATSKLESKDAFKNYDKMKQLEQDLSTFESAVKGLQSVEQKRNALVADSILNAQKYQKELDDLTKSTNELEKELSGLNQEQSNDIAKMKEIDNRLSSNKKRTDQLVNSIRVLASIKDKNTKATLANISAYRILEQEIRDIINLQNKAGDGEIVDDKKVKSVNRAVLALATGFAKLKNGINSAGAELGIFKKQTVTVESQVIKIEKSVDKLYRGLKRIASTPFRVIGDIGKGAAMSFGEDIKNTTIDLFAGARENSLKLEVVLKATATLLLSLFKKLVEGISQVALNISKLFGFNPFTAYIDGVKVADEETKKLIDTISKGPIKADALSKLSKKELAAFKKILEIEKSMADDYINYAKTRGSVGAFMITGDVDIENILGKNESIRGVVDEFNAIQKAMSSTSLLPTGALDFGVFEDVVKTIKDQIESINVLLEGNVKITEKTNVGLSDIFGKNAVTDTITDVTTTLKSSTVAILEEQVAFDTAQLSVQKLANEYENLMNKAGDGSLALKEQGIALGLAMDKTKELEKAENSLAIAQLNLAKAQIAMRVGASSFKDINEAYIIDSKLAGKISQAEADSFIEALNAVENASNGVTARLLERQANLRDILGEQFESTLDSYLDLTDSTVSAQEVLFNDEKRLLKDREDAYTKTGKIIEDSLADAIKAIVDYQEMLVISGSIDPNKSIPTTDASLRALIDGLKGGTLLITDVDKALQSFGFNGEQVTNIQAFLRDFVDFKEVLDTMDLYKLRMDFGFKDADVKNAKEYLKELKFISGLRKVGGVPFTVDEKKAQLDEFKKVQDDYADEELKRQIYNVKKKIAYESIIGHDILDLQKELLDLELQQQQNFYDKELEAQTKQAEAKKIADEKETAERAEIAKSSFALLSALNDKYADDRLRKIDREIENTSKRADYLLALADKGSEKLTENLAFEQKKQAELELQRDQIDKNRQRRALALTALELFNTNLQAEKAKENPNAAITALGKTALDISLIQALVGSLPSFFDGIEDTGSGGGLDDKNGMLAILHPHERVITAEQNKRIAGISNADLINRATNIDKIGITAPIEKLEGKLDELIRVTKSKENYLGGDYNEIKKTFVETVKKEGAIIRKHTRTDSIF